MKFLELAEEFYDMRPEEVQIQLEKLPKWQKGRTVHRVLPWREAVHRIAKDEIKQLIRVGMVGVVQCGQDLYPVRIQDVVMGIPTDAYVRHLKEQVEKEGETVQMLESVIREGGRPLTKQGIDDGN